MILALFLTAPIFAQETHMPANTQPTWMKDSVAKLERDLIAKYGAAQQERAQRGLHQVGEFWRAEDGDAAAFQEFVVANFAGDSATLYTIFNRFERLLEQRQDAGVHGSA